MNKSRLTALMLAVALLALTPSCGGKEKSPMLSIAPSVAEVVFSVDGTTATAYGVELNPVEFTVFTQEKGWKAESDQLWLTVTQKSNSFALSTTSLTASETRPDATVTVTAGQAKPVKITVRQISMLRVASYNILYANWANRRGMVIDMIQQNGFDIIGTQEGLTGHLNDLTDGTGYASIGVGRNDGGPSGEYSAIIYKTNRFELLDKGNFWYSSTPDTPSKGWDADQNRICSWGKFRDVMLGKEFYLFNSHFDNAGPMARLESAKLLLAKIKSIAGSASVLVTGDFNATPESDPVQALLSDGLLKDAYAVTEQTPYGPVGTFNDFKPTNGDRIDYILVTGGIKVKQYGVLNDRPGGEFPSDHDPVLAVIVF